MPAGLWLKGFVNSNQKWAYDYLPDKRKCGHPSSPVKRVRRHIISVIHVCSYWSVLSQANEQFICRSGRGAGSGFYMYGYVYVETIIKRLLESNIDINYCFLNIFSMIVHVVIKFLFMFIWGCAEGLLSLFMPFLTS